MTFGSEIRLIENDPYYNLRQIEVMVHNFPQYNWFDAMTGYPYGKVIDWGPVFPAMAAIACIALGASSHPEIMLVSSYVPVVLGVLMVPIMYLVGKVLNGWKTGLVAALCIAVVSGEFFSRSSFGYVTHHIAEVLFSTLFFLIVIFLLRYTEQLALTFQDKRRLLTAGTLSIMAGISYLLGILTITTILLFALITVIFILIAFIIDFYLKRPSFNLLFIFGLIFITAAIGYGLYGVHAAGLVLAQYSVAHLHTYALIVAGIVVLYFLSVLLKGRSFFWYPLSILGVALIGISGLFLIDREILNAFVQGGLGFFGRPISLNPIIELQPWTIQNAFGTFSSGIILMLAGIFVLVLLYRKKFTQSFLFVLVWTGVILLSTILHEEYEYYLAIPVCLLSALAFCFALEYAADHDVHMSDWFARGTDKNSAAGSFGTDRKSNKKSQKTKPKNQALKKSQTPCKILVLVSILLMLIFLGYSLYSDYEVAIHVKYSIVDAGWVNSMQWLGNNTPDTGVDYFASYQYPGYIYPASAYGILSWWDYGNLILFISQRLPNTNPFQQNIEGKSGAASFFINSSEDNADRIIKRLDSQYIITDSKMATTKFPAILTYYNSTQGISSYFPVFRMSAAPGSGTYTFIDQPYYETLISRLQNFDGSEAIPSMVMYVEFEDAPEGSGLPPVLVNYHISDPAAAMNSTESYNRNATPGYHAKVLSVQYSDPINPVMALSHYRLVYESGTKSLPDGSSDSVKIFKWVDGAVIKGDGMIELPLITNTGRNFTYRQESVNGTFIVPYSTTDTNYAVKATGKYSIAGTPNQYDVSEQDVITGRTIN